MSGFPGAIAEIPPPRGEGLPEVPAGAPATTPRENRRAKRSRVLKGAQIIRGDTAVDCIVSDISATGVRVRLGFPLPLPEQVVLRLRDGTRLALRRRWSRGLEAGFQLEGTGSIADVERRSRATAIHQALQAAAPGEVVRLLGASWFFGDEELRRAAESLEAAYARLEAALRPHMRAGMMPEES